MRDDQQRMFARGDTAQRGAQQRSAPQIEGAMGLVRKQTRQRRLAFGGRRVQHNHGRQERGHHGAVVGRRDDRPGPPPVIREVCAQRRMPADDLRQAAAQRRDVQVAAQPQDEREVVQGAARPPPVGQPETLLREGGRAGVLSGPRRGGVRRAAWCGCVELFP